MSYTMGLDNPTYASSVMYYPTDATPPFASAVFSPGFSATKENYQTFLGELLATHGIAMLLTTPTTTGDQPTQRGEDLVAAVAQIAKENEREGSPLKGKLAVDRVCVTGHSMGGGGTLWAATTLGSKIRCAMPLQPWQPGQSFDKIVAPTMFIAAQSDTIAGVSSNAMVFYKSIPDTVEKYYVEFAGASHFLTTNDLGTAYDGQSKYMLAFYKIHLEDDMRYRDVLNAPMDMELSMYLTSFKK
jgi:dienelactone hydrolase